MQGRRAVLGVSVTMASYLVSRAINLSVTIILARSLGPSEMGILAFALLAVEIFDFLRDFGLRETLIYDRTEDPRLRTTAFAMIMGVGLMQSAALLIFAPFAHGLVDDPVIVPVLMWMAVLFPINALGSVQDALLQRGFRFSALALAEVLGVATKAAVAISLILYGAGIWSIVIGMLCGAAVRVSIVWLASDWRPHGPSPTWEKARELFRYGRHIIASSIVNVVQMRVDQMVIVATVGDTALGIYYVAARIPEIVILGVNGVITKVVFPAFSNLSHDAEKLVAAYRTTIAASMTLIAPIGLGLAASSALVVHVVFGAEWDAAAPVLLFLVLSGIPATIGWSSGDIFKATGKPQYLWILMTIETIAVIPPILIVAKVSGDITSVAAVMFFGEIFAATIRLLTLSKVSGIPVSATLGASVRPLAAALLMALAVYLFIQFNPLGLAPGLLVVAMILLGAVVYAGTLAVIDRENLAYWYHTVFGERE
ncbi:lipopolysaccharide biosynthesis protein [Sinisalibacter aestuarii]|uniref:Lipopolysaccharide biosynthesis protein n=1 Tax=Sinisalibacter aestuarii TaxID=2949426 RepID=A0ABQ5LU60_9RHOB|nr:lipopolysaccharide biosynthesis protein [Sinisalibacter aestuarii]GKY88158.1 lipopolysaccharide biosynthesis protein [Sinisalibacter aestuarii]